jgi:chemotaxis protein methyltransferase CheR
VLRPAEFAQISQLAYEHCGLDLSNNKQGLMAARLGKKLRELGLTSFSDYFAYVKADATGAALTGMIDSLTTNHTSFFREPRHFDLLASTIYPALRDRPQIHIWSAACSSGEEPYSIAMTLLEHARDEVLTKVRIKATDISTRVLNKAQEATYGADRFAALPVAFLQRHLLKGHGRCSDLYRFKPEIRSMVSFSQLNLMDRLPENYLCSVLFCRNIMIYFDRETQENLVRRLSGHLEEGGYLFIGHSESLNSIHHELEYVCPATYRKRCSPGMTRRGAGPQKGGS